MTSITLSLEETIQTIYAYEACQDDDIKASIKQIILHNLTQLNGG